MSRSIVVEVFSTKMNDWSAAPTYKHCGNVYCEIAEGQRYRVRVADTTSPDAKPLSRLIVDGRRTGPMTKYLPATYTGFELDAAASSVGTITAKFYAAQKVEAQYDTTVTLPDYGSAPATKGKLLVTQGIGTAVPSAAQYGSRTHVSSFSVVCSPLLHEITVLCRERSALELLGVVNKSAPVPAPAVKRRSTDKAPTAAVAVKSAPSSASSSSSSSPSSTVAPAAAAAASAPLNVYSEVSLTDDGTALVREFTRLLVQLNDGKNMGDQATVSVPLAPVASSWPAKRAKPSTALFEDDDEIEITGVTMGGVPVQEIVLADNDNEIGGVVSASSSSATAHRQVAAGYTLSKFVAAAIRALSSADESGSAPASTSLSSTASSGAAARVWRSSGSELSSPQELLDTKVVYFIVDAAGAEFCSIAAL